MKKPKLKGRFRSFLLFIVVGGVFITIQQSSLQGSFAVGPAVATILCVAIHFVFDWLRKL